MDATNWPEYFPWGDDNVQQMVDDTTPAFVFEETIDPAMYIPSWILASDDDAGIIDPLLLSDSPDSWIIDDMSHGSPQLHLQFQPLPHEFKHDRSIMCKRQYPQQDDGSDPTAAIAPKRRRSGNTSSAFCSGGKTAAAGVTDWQDSMAPDPTQASIGQATTSKNNKRKAASSHSPSPKRRSSSTTSTSSSTNSSPPRQREREREREPSKAAADDDDDAARRVRASSHNEVEKKYRSRLNGQFEQLLGALRVASSEEGIPAEHCARLHSKAKVLAMAARRIRALEKVARANGDEVARLRSELSLFADSSSSSGGGGNGGSGRVGGARVMMLPIHMAAAATAAAAPPAAAPWSVVV